MNWRELLGLQPRMQDLALQLLDAARRRGDVQWRYDGQSGSLRKETGHVINLANIFIEYRNSPRAARRLLFEKYVSMMQEGTRDTPALWQLAAKSIYPVVRSAYDTVTLEISSRGASKPMPESVTWPLTADLLIRLVYDHGPSLAHVQGGMLETWGQSAQDVKQRALDNLRALQRPRWQALPGGTVYQLLSEVSFEESFLLLDAVIGQLPFAASAVVAPTNRGVLLAADGNSADAVLALLAQADHSLRENPWPMSATLLHRPDGEWREFVPTGLALERSRAMQQVNLAGVYNDQQTALQEKLGDDIFVGTFSLVRRGEGLEHIRSWCSWAEGVPTLAPKTDLVIIGRNVASEAAEKLIVEWPDVIAVCGNRLQATQENPPRFLIDSFPDEVEWQKLKAVSQAL